MDLMNFINPFSMKRSKVFEQILNGLVLLGSLAIIIVASIELLDGNNALSETFILKFHLWVCGLFLADFFVRWYTDGWTGRFFNHNLFFLLVSIPYLNIVYGLSTTISHSTWLILRLIPLARGIYGVSLIVGWMTRSRITNLFATYLTILFTTIYLQHRFLLHGTRCQPTRENILGRFRLGADERHHGRVEYFRGHEDRANPCRHSRRRRYDFLPDIHGLRHDDIPK
jgi:hypothetical protein